MIPEQKKKQWLFWESNAMMVERTISKVSGEQDQRLFSVAEKSVQQYIY